MCHTFSVVSRSTTFWSYCESFISAHFLVHSMTLVIQTVALASGLSIASWLHASNILLVDLSQSESPSVVSVNTSVDINIFFRCFQKISKLRSTSLSVFRGFSPAL